MAVWLNESKNNIRIRYATIILALVVVGQLSAHNVSIGSLALSAYQNLASVASMSAGVLPNQYNTLALELDQKDKALTTREQELTLKEQGLTAKIEAAAAANRRLTIMVLGGVTVLLLMLIFLNFYYDVKREESRSSKGNGDNHPEFSTKL